MAKVGYSGLQFWAFIEKLYLTELEKTKLRQTPPEMSSAILATVCFALKDGKADDFSDDFWRELNTVLRTFLRDQSQVPPGEKRVPDEETRSMIKIAIESNERLDDSLLRLV